MTRLSVYTAFTGKEWWKRSNSRRLDVVIQILGGCRKKNPISIFHRKRARGAARRLGETSGERGGSGRCWFAVRLRLRVMSLLYLTPCC